MKLTYRPEIDGLRAIAVSAVILYHAQITKQTFKGGFIGVDIFFVISGYLITSIILKELVSTGSFSFKNFYERRVRRILPVLLFVMLVSLPFAWMFLVPGNFIDYSKSILYSLGFSSNFYFYYSGQEYDTESALLKPFLHTWSLSVEEQFYIIFPIVLLIVFKYFRKYLIHILILGFIISLFLADWGSRNHPSFNFYVLPTRGWELLAGSILAYFEITNGKRSKNKTLNLISPTVGLLLISLSVFFFNDEMFHPSFYTLSPIVGACLIIWFSNKDELITKILSTKLFVGIGLISYSLYLWHYPIFAFYRITEFYQGSLLFKFILGIIIVTLSSLSYYFIERPFRNTKYKFKFLFSIITTFVLILVLINLYVISKDGYKSRVPIILADNYSQKMRHLLKNSEGEICYGNIEGCRFNTSLNKKVYIIGDSHVASLIFDLKDRLFKKNYQFITSVLPGCLYYPGFNKIDIKTKKIDKVCNDNYFQKLKQTLSTEKNSIIIFGGRFPLYLTNHYFDNLEGGVEGKKFGNKFVSVGRYDNIQISFQNEISELSQKNKVILIYPIPEVGWNINYKIYNQWVKQGFNKNFNLESITTSYEVYKNRTKSSFELLDSIQGNNIYRVYPHKLFCNTTIQDRCATHDDKNIFYSDDDHPSSRGVEMINDLLIKEIEQIEFKSN